MNRRTGILLGTLIVIGAVVVVDRYVIKGAGGDAGGAGGEPGIAGGDADSARVRYVHASTHAANSNRILEMEGGYAAALDRTRDHWNALRERMVVAPSASLAEAQFRDEVLEFARRREILEVRTTRIESSALGEGSGVRLIELDLEFETPSIVDVYALIDGLEHMRGMLTHVSEVGLGGPGRLGREPKVSVRVKVSAIAHIEGEG